MRHFRLTIIKDARIPRVVIAAITLMKVLRQRTIKTTQTFIFILDRMRMDNVHNDAKTHAVGGVNKFFQIIRRTKPTTGGKEI